jgi:hypothetical protein
MATTDTALFITQEGFRHLFNSWQNKRAADVITHYDELDAQVNVIQKPFRFKSLSMAVHETLKSIIPLPAP